MWQRSDRLSIGPGRQIVKQFSLQEFPEKCLSPRRGKRPWRMSHYRLKPVSKCVPAEPRQ